MGLCRWSVNSAKLPEDSHPNTPTQDGQPEYINPAKDPYAYFKHPDAKKGMSESVRKCQGILGVSFFSVLPMTTRVTNVRLASPALPVTSQQPSLGKVILPM